MVQFQTRIAADVLEQRVVHVFGLAEQTRQALSSVDHAGGDVAVRVQRRQGAVVAHAQVAGEARRERQFGADRNGDAAQLRVQRGEFGIEPAECASHGQRIGRQPVEVHVDALRLGIADVFQVVVEGHVDGVVARDLQILDARSIGRGVDAQRAGQEVGLDAELVVEQMIGERHRRHGVVLEDAILLVGELAGVAVQRGWAVALGKRGEDNCRIARRPVERGLEDRVRLLDGAVRLQSFQAQIAALDGVQRGFVTAAAAKHVAGRAVVAVGAVGVEDQAVVAGGRVLPQEAQAQRHVVAEVVAVAAPVGCAQGVRADAVAAAEGEVRCALQAGDEIVAAGAQGEAPAVAQVHGHFAEEGDLLLGARVVVEVGDVRRAWAGGDDASRWQRGVAEQKAVSRVVVVVVADVFRERFGHRSIAKVAQMRGVRLVDVDAAEEVPAPRRIARDAQFVRRAGIGRGVVVLLGGVVAVVGIGRVVEVAAAQIVGDVAAAGIVVGVVHHALDFAREMAAGVHHVQAGKAPLQRPSGEAEIVLVEVRREVRRGVFRLETGIDQKAAFRDEPLAGVLHQHVPVVVDAVEQADTAAAVAGFVPVVLHQCVVARAHDRIRRAEGRPEADAVAVHHFGARRESGGHVVDPAALGVAVDDQTQGQGIAQGKIEKGVSRNALAAAVGDAVVRVEAGLEAGRIGLARNQAHVAGLRTGAEQRALGPGEHFDAFQVRGIDVQIAASEGDRLLVDVQGDARRRALLGGNGRPGLFGGAAAQVDVLLAGAVASVGDVRQEVHVLVEGLDAEAAQPIAGKRLHRNRHILNAFAALAGGDDHGFDDARRVGGARLCRSACGEPGRGGRNSERQAIGAQRLPAAVSVQHPASVRPVRHRAPPEIRRNSAEEVNRRRSTLPRRAPDRPPGAARWIAGRTRPRRRR